MRKGVVSPFEMARVINTPLAQASGCPPRQSRLVAPLFFILITSESAEPGGFSNSIPFYRGAPSYAQVEEDKTGDDVLGLGFPIHYLDYCIPLPLPEQPPASAPGFSKVKVLGETPHCDLFRAWSLVKENVKF